MRRRRCCCCCCAPQVFVNELNLYRREGIEVEVSGCPDNSACIKLLSAKPVRRLLCPRYLTTLC
jgi:hypothetical protein